MIDNVKTIYSSDSKLHHPVFMKKILPYYYSNDASTLIIIEDSGTISLFKIADIKRYIDETPFFQTLLRRTKSVGKVQFLEIYNDTNKPVHRFLFWEDGSVETQQIMFSHCGGDSIWDTPQN